MDELPSLDLPREPMALEFERLVIMYSVDNCCFNPTYSYFKIGWTTDNTGALFLLVLRLPFATRIQASCKPQSRTLRASLLRESKSAHHESVPRDKAPLTAEASAKSC